MRKKVQLAQIGVLLDKLIQFVGYWSLEFVGEQVSQSRGLEGRERKEEEKRERREGKERRGKEYRKSTQMSFSSDR